MASRKQQKQKLNKTQPALAPRFSRSAPLSVRSAAHPHTPRGRDHTCTIRRSQQAARWPAGLAGAEECFPHFSHVLLFARSLSIARSDCGVCSSRKAHHTRHDTEALKQQPNHKRAHHLHLGVAAVARRCCQRVMMMLLLLRLQCLRRPLLSLTHTPCTRGWCGRCGWCGWCKVRVWAMRRSHSRSAGGEKKGQEAERKEISPSRVARPINFDADAARDRQRSGRCDECWQRVHEPGCHADANSGRNQRK